MKAWEEYITTAEFLVTIKCVQSSSQKHLKIAIGEACCVGLYGLSKLIILNTVLEKRKVELR